MLNWEHRLSRNAAPNSAEPRSSSVAGPTCTRARGAQRPPPRAWVPGIEQPLSTRSTRPPSAGERRGRGPRSDPAPARLYYCATASSAPPGRTPQRSQRSQRSQRTCPATGERAGGPRQHPRGLHPVQGTRRARGRRGLREGTPGTRGAGRTWLSHLARPRRSHSFPLPSGCTTLSSVPTSPGAPKPQSSPPPTPFILVPLPPHLLPRSSPPRRKIQSGVRPMSNGN